MLGGQMTRYTVEPYQETRVRVPSMLDPVQLEEELEQSRHDINVEELNLVDQVDNIQSLDPIAYEDESEEEISIDEEEQIVDDDYESHGEDDFTSEDTELEYGTDSNISCDQCKVFFFLKQILLFLVWNLNCCTVRSATQESQALGAELCCFYCMCLVMLECCFCLSNSMFVILVLCVIDMQCLYQLQNYLQ